jgi:hypothetical protein
MQYKVKVLPMKPFIINVEADTEDDAYTKAYAAMCDVEPEMEMFHDPAPATL